MTDYEKVSELTIKTGSSYEDARTALDFTGGDMLEAAILLEKAHRTGPSLNRARARENIARAGRTAGRHVGSLFDKLCRNRLEISGTRTFSIPAIAAIILAVSFGGFFIPAAVISLFCGVSYRIAGPDIHNEPVLGFAVGKPVEKKTAPDTMFAYTDEPDRGFFNK